MIPTNDPFESAIPSMKPDSHIIFYRSSLRKEKHARTAVGSDRTLGPLICGNSWPRVPFPAPIRSCRGREGLLLQAPPMKSIVSRELEVAISDTKEYRDDRSGSLTEYILATQTLLASEKLHLFKLVSGHQVPKPP